MTNNSYAALVSEYEKVGKALGNRSNIGLMPLGVQWNSENTWGKVVCELALKYSMRAFHGSGHGFVRVSVAEDTIGVNAIYYEFIPEKLSSVMALSVSEKVVGTRDQETARNQLSTLLEPEDVFRLVASMDNPAAKSSVTRALPKQSAH